MSDSEKKPQQSPLQEDDQSDKEEEDMDTGESNPSASIEGRGDRPSTSGSAKNEDKVGTDKGEVISSEEEEEENPDDASEKSEDKEEAEKKEVKGQDRGDSEKEDEEAEEDTPKKETHTEKTPKKQKRTAKEETAEEESGDDEPKLGLLEQPVIIQSGKRQKRKVERLEIAVSTPKENKLDIPEGSGTKLGDIPALEYQVTKNHADDLKPLHRLLFGKAGTATTIKKNIRKFNGFTFGSESPEYKKKQQMLNKMNIPILKPICETLTIERSGSKETIIGRIMDFVLKPYDTGKSVPKKRKRKSKGDVAKTKGKKAKGDKEKTKKLTKKAKKEDDSDEEGDESEEEEESEKEEDESEEEEEQPKKKAKTETKKPAPKKTPKKKKEETESSSEEGDGDESESEEEKPKEKEKKAPKKKKKAPSEDEIKETVKKILDGANLEEVTMKTVCKQVYAKFPDFDISDKKEFIKATVKQIIR